MGEFYQNGEGVPKDFELAARYFAQAAQQGSEDGARNAGVAFARGEGVPQDFVSAYFWLSIGALGSASQGWDQSEGSKRAQTYLGTPSALRDKLSQKMSPEQVALAQRLVRDWKPSIQIGEPKNVVPRVASEAANAAGSNSSGALVKSGLGTAFFVAEDGTAVTNNHVVEGCKELRVEGTTAGTKVLASDKANDMAILRVPRSTNAFATLLREQTKLRQGEEIVVFGYPLNSMLASGGNLTPGVVSALAGIGNNSSQIQITAAIQPGSSGSPVLNKKGEVVGVVSSKLSDSKMAQTTGSVGQNVNFAVSGQTLRSFLEAQKVAYRNGAGLMSWSKSPADLADEAKKWTFVVECWK
jgi:S1-C subfamily serine protease